MHRCTPSLASTLLLLAALATPVQVGAQQPQQPGTARPAAEDPVLLADLQAFDLWLAEYAKGQFRISKEGKVDEAALADVDARMAKIAKWNTLPAAKKLVQAASVDPVPPGAKSSTELVDFRRELQPWRIQSLAVKHLRTMTGQGILDWLMSRLDAKGLRAAAKSPEQRQAAVALKVLGGSPSLEAKLALVRASQSMPPELRVQAVAAMADDAALDTAPVLVELLRDAEPNVRIAACDALATALESHTDESLVKDVAPEVATVRDNAIAKLRELVVRDKVWQVRSAAAFSLARLRCKAAIPALIDGLEAELARKKDPWAMDVRLHKLLEGLTGQTVVQGDIRPWKEFWKAEGASFTVKPKVAPGAEPPKASKYEKFFDLTIESDRVLFVIDFSGSMAEPVQLQGQGTGARPSDPTTKAQLVVAELKKLVMSLPDGALVNLVVFSDEVRAWREDGGKPALVKLDDTGRDDLLGSFLDSLRPAGPTNLYGALDKALDFAGRGLHDKYYEAAFDTLYVITDGAPSAGEVTDKEEIRRRVREANRLRKLTIHCITFGDKNDTDFLRPMAEENGGRHIHVQ